MHTTAIRSLGASAVVAVAAAAFLPFVSTPRDEVRSGVDYLLHGEPQPILVDAHTEPAPVSGEDTAAHAVDGQASEAWSVRWPGTPSEKGEPCAGSSAASLVVTVPTPTSVDRVALTAGLARTNADWSKQQVPRTIDLLFSDGTCRRLSLQNKGGSQQFDVSVTDMTDVRLMIVDTYPPETGSGDTVSIAEVTLLRR